MVYYILRLLAKVLKDPRSLSCQYLYRGSELGHALVASFSLIINKDTWSPFDFGAVNYFNQLKTWYLSQGQPLWPDKMILDQLFTVYKIIIPRYNTEKKG